MTTKLEGGGGGAFLSDQYKGGTFFATSLINAQIIVIIFKEFLRKHFKVTCWACKEVSMVLIFFFSCWNYSFIMYHKQCRYSPVKRNVLIGLRYNRLQKITKKHTHKKKIIRKIMRSQATGNSNYS